MVFKKKNVLLAWLNEIKLRNDKKKAFHEWKKTMSYDLYDHSQLT